MTGLPPVGAKVKLNYNGNRWWDVRVADERFAILTRQAAFKPKGEVCYTILDIREGIRGPCDLIGQSWDMYMSDEKCEELLEELQVGALVNDWNDPELRNTINRADVDKVLKDRGGWVGISHRNRVPLDIGAVR